MNLIEILLIILIVEILIVTTLAGTYCVFHLEPKMDEVLAAGHNLKVESHLANTLAGSALKDSRQLNEETKQIIQTGIETAAAVTAANLTESGGPLSGDKLLRPAGLPLAGPAPG